MGNWVKSLYGKRMQIEETFRDLKSQPPIVTRTPANQSF
jgi:hypothetical protein